MSRIYHYFACLHVLRASKSRERRSVKSQNAERQRKRRSRVRHGIAQTTDQSSPYPDTSTTPMVTSPGMETSDENRQEKGTPTIFLPRKLSMNSVEKFPPPPLVNTSSDSSQDNALVCTSGLLSRGDKPVNSDPELAIPLEQKEKTTPKQTTPMSPLVTSSGGSFALKVQYRPNARKRNHELMKHLRSTPRTNCANVARAVCKMMKDPPTKKMMISYLLQERFVERQLRSVFSDDIFLQETIWINKKVTRLAVCRAKNRWTEIAKIHTELTMRFTVREVARRTGKHHSHILWYVRATKPKIGKKVMDSQTHFVVQFLMRTDISTTLPFKRFAGNFYMKMTINEAHVKYVEECLLVGQRALSLSSFRRAMPKNIKIMRKTPYLNCACIHCANFSLLVDALIACKMPDIPSRIHLNIIASMCLPTSKYCKRKMYFNIVQPIAKRKLTKDYNTEFRKRPERGVTLTATRQEQLRQKAGMQVQDNNTTVAACNEHEDGLFCITDFERDCIFRDCQNCSKSKRMERITNEHPLLDLDLKVVWRKWRNYTFTNTETGEVEKSFGLRWHEGRLSDLLSEYLTMSNFYTRHMFHYKWQVNQFEYLKSRLKVGEVLMVMDFAQNVAHAPQREVQTNLWYRETSMMHPIVCYYRCKYCSQLITEEIVFISNYKSKNSSTVHYFEKQAVLHLRANRVPVNYIYQYCDNCTGQYKCYSACDTLSSWGEIGICRSYYGEQHGKGPADGCIGRVVKHVDTYVRAQYRGLEIYNGVDYFKFCKESLETKKVHDGDCVHFRKAFKYIPSQFFTHYESEARPIPGLRKYHSIRSTGNRYILEVRENSCFCPYDRTSRSFFL